MILKELIAPLEDLAPKAIQEDYDNIGLLVGQQDMEISKVLLSVDLTGEVLDEARRKDCNLVITHHPFIFKGLKRLTGEDPAQRMLVKAVKNDIAVYAIHTNLDNSALGFNALLCEKIGLKNCFVLSPKKGFLSKLVTFCPVDYADKVREALFNAGAGHIGNYDCCSFNLPGKGTFRGSDKTNPFVGEKNVVHFENETRIELIFPSFLEKQLIRSLIANHPYEEVAYDIYPLANTYAMVGSGMIGELEKEENEKDFLSRIKEISGIPCIRHSNWINRPVKKVAVCGGAGTYLLPAALKVSADVFLTSDIRYHEFFEPQDSLLLADIGHYESEQFVKEWLYNVLMEKFPKFAVLISEINSNPVKYF